MKALRIAFTLTLIVGLLVMGCARRPREHGVLLWSPDEERASSGTLLAVVDESDISDTYTVVGLDNEDKAELPRRLVRVFDSEEQAAAFKAEYQDFARLYGRSERRALPIRAEMSSQSRRVYRLRDQQIVKVIRRSEQKHEISDYHDYWYEVMTEDGVDGWVFGRYLTVYDYDEGPTDPADVEREELNAFLLETWRPEYFERMISDGRYDLVRFDPRYGLFPEPENNRVRIVLPDHTVEFTYEDWYRIRASLWGAEGEPLEIHIRSETEVQALYSHNGREHSARFVLVDEDIRELISQEEARRFELYTEFIEVGQRFRSAAYGNLEFRENRTFVWLGYNRLVPRIVSYTAGTTGTVRFDLYLARHLRDQYDGALTLEFAGSDDTMYLLYRYVSGGVQFMYVPETLVDRSTVQDTPRAPIIMYFSLIED